MIYCTRCVYPNSKPDLTFDENGVCSACLAFEARQHINWEERKEQFLALMQKSSVSNIQPYHCIVPVSGGKDSHYQIIKVLEHGFRPLAVTAHTDDLSDIGRRNLDNISKLGVDHITVAVNPKVRRRINKYTLETIGDISWAEHVTIFTVPIREALMRKIPLIIWGENPQNEYGGPNKESIDSGEMHTRWLQEFGGLNGLRVQDIIRAKVANQRDMFQYQFPEEFDNRNVKGIFLGHYFPWDGWENARIAGEHGFEASVDPVECSGVHYENLDNYQTGIHDRFKYLKFGFGRATDIACNLIRRGMITREEGIQHVEEYDCVGAGYYLGKPLDEILEPLEMTVEQYREIEWKFANKDLFELGSYGQIHRKDLFENFR